MKRDKLLPAAQHDAVIAALYNAADEAKWSELTPQEHTRFYRSWIDDPTIGGILTRFMAPEAARSWIKDGPMKEYANASRGTGRYAHLGREGGTNANDIAQAALGPQATVVSGSQKSKPHRFIAIGSTGQHHFVAWGAAGNLRNLLWAALQAEVLDGIHAHIVILEQAGQPTTTSDRKVQQALTDRCKFRLHYVSEVPGKVRGRQAAEARATQEVVDTDA